MEAVLEGESDDIAEAAGSRYFPSSAVSGG